MRCITAAAGPLPAGPRWPSRDPQRPRTRPLRYALEPVFTGAALSRSRGQLLAFVPPGVSAALSLPGFRVLAGVCAACDGRQMGRGSGYTHR